MNENVPKPHSIILPDERDRLYVGCIEMKYICLDDMIVHGGRIKEMIVDDVVRRDHAPSPLSTVRRFLQ